ncbi:MAG: hypothetical protein WA971_00150 [Microbacterium sp.]
MSSSHASRKRRIRAPRVLIVVFFAAVLAVIVTFLVTAIAKPAVLDAPRSLDELTWPKAGSAAVAIDDGDTVSSSAEAVPMASISKIVTALMVLDVRPDRLDDEYWFDQRWVDEYHDYVARGESALEIPADGMLTEYQLLQGVLIGSACNYTDILVRSAWGDEESWAEAARVWLADHGLDGITMATPTGIDGRNTATPAALIELGRLALANPVIAEIVATPEVELPGPGLVKNTNELLSDAGVLGIKTGTLDGSNLLSAKTVTDAEGKSRRVFVVVLGQPDDDARFTASRALYAQVEGMLTR